VSIYSSLLTGFEEAGYVEKGRVLGLVLLETTFPLYLDRRPQNVRRTGTSFPGGVYIWELIPFFRLMSSVTVLRRLTGASYLSCRPFHFLTLGSFCYNV
jgi:hypothetical protein